MAWLVAGVSGLSLLLHLAVLSLWVKPFAEELTTGLSARVGMARELLALTPAEARPARARALTRDRLAVYLADPDEPPPHADASLPGDLLARLREQIGPDITVRAHGHPRGRLQFEFTLDGQPWRASYQTEPPLAAVLGTGLGWLGLLSLAVFIALTLGLRMFTRPISRLAQALSAQGGALRRLALPPQAGQEVEALVRAFNRLVDAVKRADDTKQHLLAGVSHDLRTPLARLRLRIETQCEHALADALTRDLHAVERIVSQFLAYVQGDGRVALGEPESLRAMLAQAAANYRAHGAEVSLLAGADDATLPDLAFTRLLGNLIDNALAHGSAPVQLAFSRSGAACRLVVWDCGAGLSDAEFARALQPFVRQVGRSGAADDLGHCGLGLAIAAQIAGQLGATLAAVREGPRFGVALAWASAEAPAVR